jgi:hypothetical protein
LVTVQEGAVAEADRLQSQLFGRGLRSPKSIAMAESIAEREVAIIRAWISQLNVVVEDPSSKQAVLERIKSEIRAKMEALYGR